ncbi:MAG TPA: ABC transporter permease [Trueperaceae bacterium]|nr:ABC transporter permease [Trueperaceae bacterium]
MRRLLTLVPVLIAISFVSFLLLAIIPGDPAMMMLGADASPGALEALRERLGLHRPLLERFMWWLGNAARGDFGDSLYQNRPVVDMVFARLPVTLMICVLATVVSIVIGITAGVVSAVNRNKAADHVLRVASLIGLSMPDFWLGLILILTFSIRWQVFPITGFVPLGEDFFRSMQFFILPSLALGLTLAGFLTRLTRGSMLEVLSADYVRTAKSKGMRSRRVVLRHALGTALLPLVTVIGLNFGRLLGGTVVIETVFSLPGIGRLIVLAITQRDFPVVQAAVLYVAVLYTFINLLTDLSYMLLDPRVRYS